MKNVSKQCCNNVQRNLHASVREISRACGITKSFVNRTWRYQKVRLFRLSIGQTVGHGDEIRRVNCCQFFFKKNVYKGMQILVFKFCRQMKQVSSMNNGMFNRHTKHTWSAKNTHLRRNTNNQIRDSIYVWCGIFDNWIIEQYFFKRYLNRQQNFFENQTLFHDTEIPLSR